MACLSPTSYNVTGIGGTVHAFVRSRLRKQCLWELAKVNSVPRPLSRWFDDASSPQRPWKQHKRDIGW